VQTRQRRASWFLSDQTSGVASIDVTLDGANLTPTLSKSAAATWLAPTTVPAGSTFGSAVRSPLE
jgi:hypothetical protein